MLTFNELYNVFDSSELGTMHQTTVNDSECSACGIADSTQTGWNTSHHDLRTMEFAQQQSSSFISQVSARSGWIVSQNAYI